ncbi:unnamed protein product [Prorocentrum cordatum]|uniref:Uncharacterized protein n=1 Tax=Prorocentrum cordatum TaxID=2364126 RepID=A0ABN9VS07_9DINO|nr:unnamed protein product [Polarella glacialis]
MADTFEAGKWMASRRAAADTWPFFARSEGRGAQLRAPRCAVLPGIAEISGAGWDPLRVAEEGARCRVSPRSCGRAAASASPEAPLLCSWGPSAAAAVLGGERGGEVRWRGGGLPRSRLAAELHQVIGRRAATGGPGAARRCPWVGRTGVLSAGLFFAAIKEIVASCLLAPPRPLCCDPTVGFTSPSGLQSWLLVFVGLESALSRLTSRPLLLPLSLHFVLEFAAAAAISFKLIAKCLGGQDYATPRRLLTVRHPMLITVDLCPGRYICSGFLRNHLFGEG